MMQCFVWILGTPVEDAKGLPVEDGFGHRPGIERPDLALDVGRTAPPVDPGLGLHDLGGVGDPLCWLRGSPRSPGLESLERRYRPAVGCAVRSPGDERGHLAR